MDVVYVHTKIILKTSGHPNQKIRINRELLYEKLAEVSIIFIYGLGYF